MQDLSHPRYIKLAADGTPAPADATDHALVHDTQLGLMWSARNTSDEVHTLDQATALCAASRLGGFTDWRMPTIDELESLRDRSRCNPAINVDLFPGTESDWYWSSTPHAWSPSDYAWIVDFGYGNSGSNPRDLNAFVRAVRVVSPSGQ